MKVAPQKWTPSERHGASRAKLAEENAQLAASGRLTARIRPGLPVERSIGRAKKLPRDREPRYYQDPTARIWNPGLSQQALCLCGARLDEHSPYPPHQHSRRSCDGFTQDPTWRPPPPPEPTQKTLKVGTVAPRLDANELDGPNLATIRAKLLDALRPFSGKRTRNCRSKRVAPIVQVQRDNDRVSLKGLETCASVWGCPCCAALIYARRAAELTQALERWSGFQPLMMTLTVRHGATDSLRFLRKGLSLAWRHFWTGRGGQERKALLDIRHIVRALEVTYGENGWHPHLHAFLFCGPDMPLEDDTPREPDELVLEAPSEPGKKRPRPARPRRAVELDDAAIKKLKYAWRRAVVKAFTPSATQRPDLTKAERVAIGMRYRPTVNRGLDVRPYKESGGYLAKAGLEVHAITKSARADKSMTPWDIARKAAAGDRIAVTLWQGYVGAMYGARQLTWSRGARRRFGLSTGETDEDVLHEEEQAQTGEVKQLVVQWTGKAWDRQRRSRQWFARVTQACHSATATLDLAALPGAEFREVKGIVIAAAQPELARAGPRAGPPP